MHFEVFRFDAKKKKVELSSLIKRYVKLIKSGLTLRAVNCYVCWQHLELIDFESFCSAFFDVTTMNFIVQLILRQTNRLIGENVESSLAR